MWKKKAEITNCLGLLQEPYPKGLIPLYIIGMVRSTKDNKFQVITKHRIFVFRAESEGKKSHPDPKVPFFSSCYFCFSKVAHYSPFSGSTSFSHYPLLFFHLHWKWENVERPDFFLKVCISEVILRNICNLLIFCYNFYSPAEWMVQHSSAENHWQAKSLSPNMQQHSFPKAWLFRTQRL